jgi:hypothetical protein
MSATQNLTKLALAFFFLLAQMAFAQEPPDFSTSSCNTEASPCIIKNVDSLLYFAEKVNDGTAGGTSSFYKLDDDFDGDLSGKSWTPIGNSTNAFQGSFDGNLQKISNLSYSGSNNYVGFFGYITSGTVKNLAVVNAYISSEGYALENVGIIVGYINSGTIQNVYTTGYVSGYSYVGGIAGYNSNGGEISYSYSTAEVSGYDFAGGIAGMNTGSITYCAALNPAVKGKSSAGRIAYGYSSTYSDNVAYSFMTDNNGYTTYWYNNSSNTQDGADITLAEIKANGTINNIFNDGSIWTTEDGKLPGFGEAEELPEHMAPVINSIYFSDDYSYGSQITEANLLKDSYRTIYLYVDGTIDRTVEFSGFDEATSEDTYYSENCYYNNPSYYYTCEIYINIGEDETAETLTLTATSNGDPTKTAYLTVNVVEAYISNFYTNNYITTSKNSSYEVYISINTVGEMSGMSIDWTNGNSGITIAPGYSEGYQNSPNEYTYYFYYTITTSSSIANGSYTITACPSIGDQSFCRNITLDVVDPYIDYVYIYVDNYSVAPNTWQTAEACVQTVGNVSNKNIDWSFSPSVSYSVNYSESGPDYYCESIGFYTPSSSFTITARSNADPSMYDSKTITVITPPSFTGNGTQSDPYIIATAADLASMATAVNNCSYNYQNAYYKLANDIDLSSYSNWTPIGNSGCPFRGVFDGNYKKISNLNVYVGSYAGLFGRIGTQSKNAEVKNLGVVNAYVYGSQYVGIIAGLASGSDPYAVDIQNVYTTGYVEGYYYYVGGVVGSLQNWSGLKNSYSTAEVYASYYAGGLAGMANELRNSVALNPSVSGSSAGRVTYSINWEASNNYAFAGMPGSWYNIGSNDEDGADITAAQINADGTLGGLFTAANGWATANGKLPGFGTPEDMPAHLALPSIAGPAYREFNSDMGGSIQYNVTGTASIASSTGDACSGISFSGNTLTVNSGLTPNDECELTITASANGETASLTVTIKIIPPATVTSVAIASPPTEVQKTQRLQLKANVVGTNNPPKTVTWVLTGNESEATAISGAGRLTVAANETAATLKIKAVSTFDNTKSSTEITIEVTDAPPAVAKPEIESVIARSITIKAVAAPSTGQTVEYAISDKNTPPASGWQTGLTFSSLAPSTSYYIFARAQGNTEWLTGEASEPLEIGTATNILASGLRFAQLGAYMKNGTLHLTGLNTGKAYSVYSVSGALMHQGIASGASASVRLNLATGVYIVKSENRATRFVNK